LGLHASDSRRLAVAIEGVHLSIFIGYRSKRAFSAASRTYSAGEMEKSYRRALEKVP
jgi:hypothetical protein